ncbi:BTB domain-containing protein [Mycena sanguinolenta]|uniref:BTB domain-containing protein n=1 Tax=Mycena sanguinolenta TaxID=230812 RepID=A0A8H7DJF0_9AGAR|nr:BTB domain-containing protein [Mycena sanguinolenta]
MSQTSKASPAKRQRTEEELTRSDIWHDDGSVVLLVESTLFRVHWGVICLHSTFFRDMRDLPQPADQPNIEGCPVIELHDSLEDVEHLLHALHNTLVFNKEKLSFPFIAAMVRMGRKYDFKNLLEAAMQRLQEEHPVTLEKHETFLQRAIAESRYIPHTIVDQPGLVFDMLTLVRENNLFTLLPSAYFRAIFHHSKNQWHSYELQPMLQTFETPPAKRQRTEEELTRSDIWHDDGSVVLLVESTLFRVHWGVICLHSTFFRDMRDLPQPADQLNIEGCPVIELHDSLEDVKHLLDALYNPLIFNKQKLSFPFIAAMVRMGRKYDFNNLLEAAVLRLQEEHPVTLEKHETFLQRAIAETRYIPRTIVDQPGLVFDMLTLARENNLFTMLPSAYFRAIFHHSKVRLKNSSHL